MYCHLDHFSAEEYFVYNTDCQIDIGRQRIRVLCRQVDDLIATLKRFLRKLNCQSFNEIQDTYNRIIQKSLREEELGCDIHKVKQDINKKEGEIDDIVDDLVLYGIDLP